MERFILKKLPDWKNSPYRKPMILKEFGKRYYENTAYFNLKKRILTVRKNDAVSLIVWLFAFRLDRIIGIFCGCKFEPCHKLQLKPLRIDVLGDFLCIFANLRVLHSQGTFMMQSKID